METRPTEGRVAAVLCPALSWTYSKGPTKEAPERSGRSTTKRPASHGGLHRFFFQGPTAKGPGKGCGDAILLSQWSFPQYFSESFAEPLEKVCEPHLETPCCVSIILVQDHTTNGIPPVSVSREAMLEIAGKIIQGI